MEFLILIGGSLLAFGGAMFGNLLASEAYDKCGWWAERIIRIACRQFPTRDRDRYEEEWLAHLRDCEGNLSKLVHALGVLWSAWSISRSDQVPSPPFSLAEAHPVLRRAFLTGMALQMGTAAAVAVAAISGTKLYLLLSLPPYSTIAFVTLNGVMVTILAWWMKRQGRFKQ